MPLGPVVEGARFLTLQEVHREGHDGGEGKRTDRNVILPVALTPEIRQKLAALPDKPIESMLFA